MTFRDDLRTRAARSGVPIRLALPEASDDRVRRAADQVRSLRIADPLLIGRGGIDPAADERLPAVADHLRARRPAAVRDAVHALDLAADPLRFAAALVALGQADACIGGADYTTAQVIRAALWAIGMGPRTVAVTAAMYLALPDGRLFTFTDIAVIPMPTPEQLASAAIAAAHDRRALIGDEPMVAFLSYSTKGSAAGPDIDRVRAALDLFRRAEPGIPADGELQLDAAVMPAIGAAKAPGSPVAGRANVLVFPSLDAGNIGYKLTERFAGATATGPLLQGLARPMSDLSRGATPDDIVDVAAMLALQARAQPQSREDGSHGV